MTENCKLRKAIYIIRILQHFATKLRNITNFVMLLNFCLDQNLVYNANGPLSQTRMRCMGTVKNAHKIYILYKILQQYIYYSIE
jgi:hypothetical protein